MSNPDSFPTPRGALSPDGVAAQDQRWLTATSEKIAAEYRRLASPATRREPSGE